MIALKPGVRVGGIKPELLLAIMVLDDIFASAGQPFIITALTDGQHMPESKHYTGHAVDIRTRDVNNPAGLAAKAKERLGMDYDVLFEGAGTENQHLHIEFDPK